MANTVEVSSNIWNWINTSVQVPDAVREKFEQWRSGEKKPTFSQLEEFSRKIHVPIGYFFWKGSRRSNLNCLSSVR